MNIMIIGKVFQIRIKAPYLTHSAALYGQLHLTPGTNEYLERINEKVNTEIIRM